MIYDLLLRTPAPPVARTPARANTLMQEAQNLRYPYLLCSLLSLSPEPSLMPKTLFFPAKTPSFTIPISLPLPPRVVRVRQQILLPLLFVRQV